MSEIKHTYKYFNNTLFTVLYSKLKAYFLLHFILDSEPNENILLQPNKKACNKKDWLV